jgi:hypothetical protein
VARSRAQPPRPTVRSGSVALGLLVLAGLMLATPVPHATAQTLRQTHELRFDLSRGPLFSLPPPPIEELRTGGAGAAEGLVMLRLQHVRERRREGGALLTLGLVGVLGGALVSVLGRDDPGLLAFGLTTLSFGAINVPLGIGLLDLRHRAREDALELTAANADTVSERLAEWARSERWKRVSFAVNAGLDVLYMLTGALLVGLAGRTNQPGSARGAGWAMVTQGAALFVYDLYGIRATTRRMQALTGDAWLEPMLLY